MYGTTMIATIRGTRAEVEAAFGSWLSERAPVVPGFVDAGIQVGDDGRTLINWARFTDRDAYLALADDPAQDAWYQSRIAPLLDGEARWVDGEWMSTTSEPTIRLNGTTAQVRS